MLCIGMVACSNVRENCGSDRRQAYFSTCSGTAMGWDKCFIATSEIFGSKDYGVLERNNEQMTIRTSGAMIP